MNESTNHGVSEAFQLWVSSEAVGDAELATASWSKRTYGRNERGAAAANHVTKSDISRSSDSGTPGGGWFTIGGSDSEKEGPPYPSS